MHHHLGHARGAGGEVDDQDVAVAQLRRDEALVRLLNALAVVQPALPLAAAQGQIAQVGALGLGLLDLFQRPGLVRRDDHADVGRVYAVGDVLGGQLDAGGDEHHAQPMQRQGGDPILPVALEDEQHPVALLQPKALQIAGRLLAQAGHLLEAELPPVAVVVQIDQGALVGLGLGPGVHHVPGEAEVARHVQLVVFLKILVGIKARLG